MSVPDTPPGTRRRPAPRRRLATVAALVTSLAAALVLPGLGLSVPSPAYADSAVGRDIRTGLPGTALTWGGNHRGQLGDGNTAGSATVPGRVCGNATCTAPLDKAVQVAAGDGHSIALLEDGTVLGWGNNASGQLGDSTKTDRATPVRVCAVGEPAPCAGFLEGVTSIGAGDSHTIAVARPLADLATSIGASPEPVANGGTLTYTVRVHNYGPTSAEDVVLTDHLPTTVRYAGATPSTGHCDTPPTGTTNTVTCHFGTLARGGAATVTIAVKVRSTGSVTNVVSATGTTPDPRPVNNSAAITTPVG
ncbi:hypothetical protein AB0F25_04425 [Streptomyces wedmorensis]|uniref:DUF7927 domain-containing protein n=1 Tax=Streptomyces wedmorensis TaxID=43759 RepID=UPI00342A29C5